MQKVSDAPPATCPECGERRMAKVVSRTSFQLKGGGWYADLYSSAGKGKAKPETGGAKPETGGGTKPSTSPAPAAGASSTAGPATSTGGDKPSTGTKGS
jgi:predicted nucleic acid-binding Zn ribbon protein